MVIRSQNAMLEHYRKRLIFLRERIVILEDLEVKLKDGLAQRKSELAVLEQVDNIHNSQQVIV